MNRKFLIESSFKRRNIQKSFFHITLARRARIPHVGLPHLAFPQNDEATDVTLYKSTLDRAGAVYKPLHTVCLGTIAAERV